MDALKLSFFSTISIVIPILVFSIIFSGIEKFNSRLILSVFGYKGIVITGAIGTIIHEFSHMLMCVIFRHNITEFSMFRPVKGSYDGVMGYVNHSYNKKSLYQNLGNFFIGIAPIIFGIGFLILFMWLLLPNEFAVVKKDFDRNLYLLQNANDIKAYININISTLLSLLKILNPLKQSNIFMYIIYIFTMYSVSTHMDLSPQDLKNAKNPAIACVGIMFIIFYILSFTKFDVLHYAMRFSVTIIAFLSIGLLFSLITYVITKILAVIFMR